MKQIVYQALKISLAVIVAIFIAEFFGLMYATTAGVVTMLSILDSRRQTYIVGFKRLISAMIAIVIALPLFMIGHNLWVLGLFLLVFIPVSFAIRLSEGLTVSTVLITHIYTIQTLNATVAVNEVALVFIGVIVAFIVNIHMPKGEEEIKQIQLEVEAQIRLILHKMKLQLLNQCSMSEQQASLDALDSMLTLGTNKAIVFSNNGIFKDRSYYIRYFQMRRQQYLVLIHMENHFEQIFIAIEEAKLLSDFTEQLALTFNESNNGVALLEEAKRLREHYKQRELPKTREEFENRAVLFQYFSDLIYFIEIKHRFMPRFKSNQ